MTAAKGNGDWGLGIEPNPQSPFPLEAVIHDLYYNTFKFNPYKNNNDIT